MARTLSSPPLARPLSRRSSDTSSPPRPLLSPPPMRPRWGKEDIGPVLFLVLIVLGVLAAARAFFVM